MLRGLRVGSLGNPGGSSRCATGGSTPLSIPRCAGSCSGQALPRPTHAHHASTVILMLVGWMPSVRASLDFATAMVSGSSLASPVLAGSVAGGEGGLAGGTPPAAIGSSPAANETRAIGLVARPAPAPTNVGGSSSSFS